MVIIGAGEAGVRAALALREGGHRGSITLVGDEPHLPYERPPLSKNYDPRIISPELKVIATEEQLALAEVEHVRGERIVAVDPIAKAVKFSNGTALSYAFLLLATGAIPRRLPMAEPSRHCVYFRTYDDAVAIRSRLGPGLRVVIVGGGFIGLELAASARQCGASVTVIEAQPRILMRGVPAEIAATIGARHERAEVEIVCGVGLADIVDDSDSVTFTLSNGRMVEADLAVIGVGATPVIDLAKAAGLTIENGIAVDSNMRTSDPNIFAAGDCCSFPLAIYGGRRVRLEAWRSAQEHGTLAARNMLGNAEQHCSIPWFWSDQYELGLQVVGLSDEGTSVVRRDIGADCFILFHLAADLRLVAASGIGPINSVARDVRLAEMLIAKKARPAAEMLARPEVKLKSLLES
ncbi:NAD(P)/FAD-dependent oxidoreductase [Acidisoma sp. S159]|uniref:NAD(P)/FAD-dependent oxidoreductase n=1 Tax=Acidisoma sp. S159 TaxID=1747225 RepID=UPI00131DFD27|nr:FAD-dependent oxidoreductase [Acidisoma sp. S159]